MLPRISTRGYSHPVSDSMGRAGIPAPAPLLSAAFSGGGGRGNAGLLSAELDGGESPRHDRPARARDDSPARCVSRGAAGLVVVAPVFSRRTTRSNIDGHIPPGPAV